MKNKFTLILLLLLYGLPEALSQNQPPPEWSQCSACHVLGQDMVGPDLVGVTEKRDKDWLYRFIRNSQEMIREGDPQAVEIWEEYNKVPMPSFDLSDEQIRSILEYVENYDPEAEAEAAAEEKAAAEEGHADVEEFVFDHMKFGPGNTRPTFIIFLILFVLALIDLTVTRVIRIRFIHAVVLTVSAFVCIEITVVEAQALGRQEGYAPDQPVWFSHKVHAGQNKIDCNYCHSSAYESKSAGIPGTDVCMNCHNVVRKGTRTGEKEIAKVIDSWESGAPIEWIRVHNLPDHAYFSHAQHVNVGKRDCAECHGEVEMMDKIIQVENLGMGWCIHCHRDTEVQFETNGYYKQYERFHKELEEGTRERVTVDDIGGNNCQMCHY